MRAGVSGICLVSVVTCAVVCSCVLASAAGSGYQGIRSKPRTIRGFKNVALSTARGFGKRANPALDFLAGYNDDHTDRNIESLPVEWFVAELQSNPELARLVVTKFLDANQDGLLTADELLRPAY